MTVAAAAHRIVSFLVEDGGSWDFVTELTRANRNITAYGIPDNMDFNGGKAVINWHLDIDARSWGINEIAPVLKSIQIDLVCNEHTDELHGPEHTFRIEYNHEDARGDRPEAEDAKGMANFYDSYTAKIEWNRQESHDPLSTLIAPTSVEVDIGSREITVNFG